jgi:hypothetical protein
VNIQQTLDDLRSEPSGPQPKNPWPEVDLQKIPWAWHNPVDAVRLDEQSALSVVMHFISMSIHQNGAPDRLRIVLKIMADIHHGTCNEFFLVPLCRHLLTSVPPELRLRTHVEQVLVFIHLLGINGIFSSAPRPVLFTKEDISRFLCLDLADVVLALEVLRPFILKCHPPFRNPDSEIYLCLNLEHTIFQLHLQKVPGNQAWVENALHFLHWYGSHLASSVCSLQPSGM